MWYHKVTNKRISFTPLLYSVVLDCCEQQEKLFLVFCNPFHATVFLLSAFWFLLFFFSMQGGEVIDKVMMIKDVHGPEAWVPKKSKN